MTQHPAWLLIAFGLVIAGNGINVQNILPSCEFLEHKPSETAKKQKDSYARRRFGTAMKRPRS